MSKLQNAMGSPAIILSSGGLDSTTCLAIARTEGFAPLYSLSFDYGQRHRHELNAARRVATAYQCKEHRVITIDLRQFGNSALTDDIAVPKDRDESQMACDIPVTYVPARNTIFLSYALAFAEVRQCLDIFIGVNAVDYSGYPDCRPEFVKAFEAMANLATAITTMKAETSLADASIPQLRMAKQRSKITIHAPLVHLTKAEIIRRGTGLGVDYSVTHSCYDPTPEGLACGRCDSCVLRKKGFAEAGVPDPTRYA
jgi:7-cyano-7-deazaguanine synthase